MPPDPLIEPIISSASDHAEGFEMQRARTLQTLVVALVAMVVCFSFVQGARVTAAGETLTLAVSQATGTAPFNTDDAAGHDSSASNSTVRTNDTIVYSVELKVDTAPSTNNTFTLTLAKGTELKALPAFCGAGSSLTNSPLPAPVKPVTATSWTTLPIQLVTCNVGARTANSTLSYPFPVVVRPEVPNGTVLTMTSTAKSDGAPTPVVGNPQLATVSARAQYDISKDSTALTANSGYFYSDIGRVCSDGSGRLCAFYSIPVVISTPAGGKGLSPLGPTVTFTDDLSPAALYPAGVTSDPDWIAAGAGALAKYGAMKVSCTASPTLSGTPNAGIGVPNALATATNSVRSSGTTTCVQPGGPGTPVTLTVTNADWSAYTFPSVDGVNGSAIPGGIAYVYSTSIQFEIPTAAILDLGVFSASPKNWSLAWKNTLTNFAPTDIGGTVNDPTAQLPFNDYRASTAVVSSAGSFEQFYVGVPGSSGNSGAILYSGAWEGPPGGTGAQTGDGQIFANQDTQKVFYVTSSGTAITRDVLNTLACDAWDPTLMNVKVASWPTGGPVAPLQRMASVGATGVYVSGRLGNATYATTAAPNQAGPLPVLTVEYGTGAFANVASCNDADSPTGWVTDPSTIPGNDPVLAAQGIYTAATKVRINIPLIPAASGTNQASIALGFHVRAGLPLGTVVPNWTTAKSFFSTSALTQAQMLAAPNVWVGSSYNPANNSGGYGDRLTVVSATVRLSKTVKEPSTGVYGKTTVQVTGGQTAAFRITPTLTAAVNAPTQMPVVVEDCIPSGASFLTSTPGASTISQTTPAGAGITCAAGQTYVKWDLGLRTINTVIPPIDYTVTIPRAASSGNYVNTAVVTAPGDSSPVASRTDTATINVAQPAGIVIDKLALTPLVQVNPAGNAANDLLKWRVHFANINTVPGPSDADMIDILPVNGANGTSYHGTLAFSSATVVSGAETGQPITIYYTKAAPASISPDAGDASNGGGGATVWCTAPTAGTVFSGAGTAADCPASPAEVTGLRVQRPGIVTPSDDIAFDVAMLPLGNQKGDAYVNQAAGRAVGLTLLVGPAVASEAVVSSSIGDTVFTDVNMNGIQDAGDTPLAGFPVTLNGTDDLGNPVTAATVTNAAGNYMFDGLRAGNYTVTFQPSGLTGGQMFTYQKVGTNASVDSNGNPTTGAATVVLSGNFDDTTVDQGVIAPKPSLTIVKSINGDDANAAPGVLVTAGSTMSITYLVTNTGNQTLTNVHVTDDHAVAAMTCPTTTLTPGENETCTATYPAPTLGQQHTDIAIAHGTPPLNPAGVQPPAVDSSPDPANAYVPGHPAVTITKAINGDPADTAPGVQVAVGSTMAITYVVTNTGDVALKPVVITDDKVASGSISCPATSLAPGESETCTATLPAPAAGVQHTNTGTVTGTAANADGSPMNDPLTGAPFAQVTASNPANAWAATTSVAIVKRINGDDADTAPGVAVAAESTMNITFDVTNTGTVTLMNVTVTDDVLAVGSISCPQTTLLAGESMQCTATLAAPLPGHTHTDIGTVLGDPVTPDGDPLLDPTTGSPVASPTDSNPANAYTPDSAVLPAVTTTSAPTPTVPRDDSISLLPFTGSNAGGLLNIACLAIVIGAILFVRSRRRAAPEI